MLTLNRLPRRQRVQMIAHVTGGKTMPQEIMEQIVDRTDGVPLFIEELTKAVVESGVLTDADVRCAVRGPVAALAIPATLQASLLARLDRLAPAREAVQIGATLGRSFSHELISAVAGMPQSKLDDALEQVVGAELIYRRGVPPDAEYTFKHALVQDAAYSTLLRNRRQQLHARIVTTLEGQFPQIVLSQPALLAHHSTESGQIEKAIRYRLKAGQRAIARSTMIEAVAQLRAGLALLTNLPEDAERQKYELDLQMTLVLALFATEGYTAQSVMNALARARQLCGQLNTPVRLARVLSGQFVYHLIRAEPVLANRIAKELLDLGEAENNVTIKFAGHTCSTQSWFELGDFNMARAHAEHAIALHDPSDPPLWTTDAHAIGLIYSCRSLLCLGYLDRARSRGDEALARARQLRHAATLASVLAVRLHCAAHLRSDSSILLVHAEELATLCAEHGLPYWDGYAKWTRGYCLMVLGCVEEGLVLVKEAKAAANDMRALSGMAAGLTFLADALGKAGRPTEGLMELEEAAHHTEATGERWAEANMHRVGGELLIAVGDSFAAEARFRKAITVACQQNAKLWELLASMSLARLWRDQGKHTEACDLLAPVYNWFTEGFDTSVLKDAKALLEQLSA